MVSDFVREYAAGRTPIPCVHCNGDLKFATLVERAAGFDADLRGDRATTRASSATSASGRYRLLRGVDPNKDQSYFLFTLTQAQLAHAMFPVGALDKPAVRELARELGLQVADKPDSHEICFVADGDHAAFLARQGPRTARARSATSRGQVVGSHGGVHRFTVGQRKGLGLSSPIPLYVVGIDAAANAVTVGPARGARPSRADRLRRELDRRDAAGDGCARDGADSPPAQGSGGDDPADRRRPRERHLRQAAGRHRARPGAGDVSGRRGRRRRLDRLTECWNAECWNAKNAEFTKLCSSDSDHFARCQLPDVLRHALEVFLGVDRRHAAGAGGGDRLAVDVVLDVAARRRRRGRSSACLRA